MNMIKKVSEIAAGVALAFGLAAPASAAPFSVTAGDIKITFNAFDAGTTGYGNTEGVKCENVADCDAAIVDNASPNAVGSEDTWGIFSVQSITYAVGGGVIFTAGQNGQYLTGVFGGLKDAYVKVNEDPIVGPSTQTLSEGGWLNMYLTGQNYDPTFGPDGRIDEFGYQGITDVPGGILALAAEFAPSVVLRADGKSYYSTFVNEGVAGSGFGYLDVIGGEWKDLFDSNSLTDPQGGKHDLLLTTSFDADHPELSGWTVEASGDVEGRVNDVPEPGSLALLGLGFAGLASLRRRRAAK